MKRNSNNLFTKKQKLYSCAACEQLFAQYYERGGDVVEIIAGSLGYGLTICTGYGLKTAIVKEVYLNTQSSAHTIRMYNETPKKYAAMLEQNNCYA